MTSPDLFVILERTPRWVWGVLVLLVVLGLTQSRDHVVGRLRLLAMPAVLGLLSLAAVAKAFGAQPLAPLAWLAGLAAGIAAYTVLRLPMRAQALSSRRFAVGGSWLPLGLMVGVFALRYAVSVALAITPALALEAGLALPASLAFGLMAGLFAGRALRVLGLAPKGTLPLAA